MPEVTDPDLTLRVTQETLVDGRKVLKFLANTRERRRRLYYTSFDSRPFEVDPQQHFEQLFGDIALIPYDRSQQWLEGRGAMLCRDLIPETLRREIWALLDSVCTVQILSNEVWIPWELLWLRNPDDPSSPGRFLVEAFSVTRWPLDSPPVLELPMQRIALVIPRDAGLPTSAEEGRRLEELSGASRKVVEVPATLAEVTQAMASGTYDGWHFAGHGVASADSPQRWSIVLEQQEELQPPHLYSLAGQFGRAHPLVFLNACSSGRGATSLSGAAGLATAFLEAGAGAFLGSHWEIEDEHAFCFAEELYSQLFSGREIGEAVRLARAKLRRDFPNSSDWLAYTVFAHPLARCAPAPAEQPARPCRPAHGRWQDSETGCEPDEVVRSAGCAWSYYDEF